MMIRYSARAIRNLDGIREYIEKDNPEMAWVVASFIRRSIMVLNEWPFRGRATEKESIRRLVVTNYPYVVYYQIRGEDVLIVSVMHAAQDR